MTIRLAADQLSADRQIDGRAVILAGSSIDGTVRVGILTHEKGELLDESGGSSRDWL
jgi:hypothetical protein